MWQNNRFAPRSVWLAAMLVAVLLLATACGQGGGTNGGDIVAEYEGGTVAEAEFEQFKSMMQFTQGPIYAQMEMLDPDFERNLLTQYIAIKLSAERADEAQSQRARQSAIDDWDEAKQLYEEHGQEEALLEMLDEHGVTEEQLIDFVTMQNKAMYVYKDEVTERDVSERYDELKERHQFDQATLRHVLIGTTDPFSGETTREDEEALALALEVREKLLEGGDFDELAAEYSDDPGSSANGGRYENVNVNNWTPAFRDAALELPIGEISEPIKTEYGYHIMKVESRSTQTLDEVRESLETNIASERLLTFMQEEVTERITAVYLPESGPEG